MSVTTFMVNYQGHPFMQSFWENKYLRNCIFIGYAIILMANFGLLNPIIQITPLAFSLRLVLFGLMAADLVFCKIAEVGASTIFSKYNDFVV